MTCSEVQGELPLFVGGDLESPGRERVLLHLGSCTACSQLLAQASAVRDARLEHFEDSAARGSASSLWPNLRQRLRSEGLIRTGSTEAGATAGGPALRGRLLRFMPLAAAAVGLFYLGTLYRGGVLPNSDGPTITHESPSSIENGSVVENLVPVGTLSETERLGRPLRAMGPADEFLSERAAPYYGEVLRPFNAFYPVRGSNSPACYGVTGNVNSGSGVR